MKSCAPVLILLALAGCGKGANETGPGGVTVGEARALDDAAEMLDQRRLPQSALTPSAGHSPDAVTPPTAPASQPAK
jgi:hypothetical protein